ncbi:MAG: SMP-30/gluconolactonase/LRE family protein [Candidatus Aminicenantes bacterium]|nr:SMP-30/gluconolactonase/LRE family protein [Candidatus Aminicenantes bacterium]
MRKQRTITASILAVLLAAFVLAALPACAKKPAWAAKNDKLITEKNIVVRTRGDIPSRGAVPNLADGVMTTLASLPEVLLAPGVKAKMYWAKGNLVAWLTLDPGASLPKETLPAERIMVVMKGAVSQFLGGANVEMRAETREDPDGTHGRTPRNDLLLLEKGTENAVQAGVAGAEIVEVYWPVRADYLAKAGVADAPPAPDVQFPIAPTVTPGTVYDLNDIQFTELQPGANSRLIGGHGAQLSFLRMDPGMNFAAHLHPEAQLMCVLRGAMDELILDATVPMKTGDLLYLPATMVHGGAVGEVGCDVLDVFFPPRPDYTAKKEARDAAFHAVIPASAEVELFVDGSKSGPGLTFNEGPKWLAGKLYVSSMFFDQKWNGSPAKSKTVEVDPDGTYRVISKGLQTNGLMPLPNGNLAVCDMFGHRVVEMTVKGKIVKTLASTFEGKPIDGPNDIVTDAKGGIYFTDPQFTPEAKKFQPGRAVYYIRPDGKLVRIIPPNDFAMPNGILLSPDGKTLYVNNTYDNESFWNVDSDKDNWIWAFDVKDDGGVANPRKFALLVLTPEVVARKGRSSGADGMTIDANGGLYVATYMGVQVFSAKGEFLGIINTPVYPVSCCFGGDDMQTLFIVGYDKIFKVQTAVKGLKYGPK